MHELDFLLQILNTRSFRVEDARPGLSGACYCGHYYNGWGAISEFCVKMTHYFPGSVAPAALSLPGISRNGKCIKSRFVLRISLGKRYITVVVGVAFY